LLYLYKTSRPHIAEVGLVSGTEHFRNVLRHKVQVSSQLASLRVDESLYFANARVLEDRVNALVSERPALRHLVMQCSAINDIDASALESLETIDQRLRGAGLKLHLSEVKGPVMDRLQDTDFLAHLSGRVFLSHFEAMQALWQQPHLSSRSPPG
jgi:SulP family sulfate permease